MTQKNRDRKQPTNANIMDTEIAVFLEGEVNLKGQLSEMLKFQADFTYSCFRISDIVVDRLEKEGKVTKEERLGLTLRLCESMIGAFKLQAAPSQIERPGPAGLLKPGQMSPY